MKKISVLFWAFVFAVCAVHSFAGDSEKLLTVTGVASISAAPDEAVLNIGVRTENTNYKVCQETNKNKINDVLAAIRKLGIEDRYIQTASYSSQILYKYEYNTNKFMGYEINHLLAITFTDLDLVGKVIEISVEQGANELHNVQFMITKPREHELYLRALEVASSRARDKAEVLAKSFGINNMTVKNIDATSSYVPTYRSPSSLNIASNEIRYSEGGTSDVAGGQIQVTANVTITYIY